MKLGKKPAKYDSRTLRLKSYMEADRSLCPRKCDWAAVVPHWPMYLNDQIGDCAIAGPAHQVQAWTANDEEMITPTDQQVLDGYSLAGGWVPGDPSTDNGCYLLDVMKIWRNEGLFGSSRISAFAAVDVRVREETRQGIFLFGGLCIGLSLPIAVDGMTQPWDVPERVSRRNRGRWERGSWGGHCVELVGYDEDWLYSVTWGRLQLMSWNFYQEYCDEAYLALSRDWLGSDSVAPSGFNSMQLFHDLKRLD